jgi:hypothetical protein
MVSFVAGKSPSTPLFQRGKSRDPFPAGCIGTAFGKVKYDFSKQKVVRRDTNKV